MLKLIFRILFVGLGLFTTVSFGKDAFLPVWHKITGVSVEGRIIGFLAGGTRSTTVLQESTGVRKGKRKSRRPVFRYPVAPGSADSLEAHSSVGTFQIFGTFETGDKVPVVFAKSEPANARIFNIQMMFISLLVVLLGLYMLRIGILGRLD